MVSWLSPLFLFFTTAVGMAAGAVMLAALCAGLFRGRGPARRRLVLLALALGAALAVRYGGGVLLAASGLAWRSWVRGLLALVNGGLMLTLLTQTARSFRRLLPDAPGWTEALAALCWVVVMLGVLGCCFIGFVFGSWTDRVGEYAGQKVVVEYTGVFRATGYRYVNWFVHGEEVYVWQD